MTPRACAAAWLIAAALPLAAQPDTLPDAEPPGADAGTVAAAEEALATSERLLGAESPGALAARGRLALLRIAAGDPAGAESLLRRNWALRSTAQDPRQTRGLLSGRGLLPARQAEPAGYGLYSYLLFDSSPRDDAERRRYLKAIEAQLRLLPAVTELERYQRRSRLNLVLLPVREEVELPIDPDGDVAQAAQRALRVYDYARAKVLLERFGRDDLPGGPYIVSHLPGAEDAASARLFLDLSRVEPDLVSDWTRTFCWLAAQERPWSEAALQRLALTVRNAIAVAARQLPALGEALLPEIAVGPRR